MTIFHPNWVKKRASPRVDIFVNQLIRNYRHRIVRKCRPWARPFFQGQLYFKFGGRIQVNRSTEMPRFGHLWGSKELLRSPPGSILVWVLVGPWDDVLISFGSSSAVSQWWLEQRCANGFLYTSTSRSTLRLNSYYFEYTSAVHHGRALWSNL